MTSKESKTLKRGDKIIFSDGVKGEVRHTDKSGIYAVWEDGQDGVIFHDDMRDVSHDLAVEMSR